MKYWVKFYKLSTGYVAGTIPPIFSEVHKKPIEACGSDSFLRLDGRLKGEKFHQIAIEHAKRLGYIGYAFSKGERMHSPLYTSRFYSVVANLDYLKEKM